MLHSSRLVLPYSCCRLLSSGRGGWAGCSSCFLQLGFVVVGGVLPAGVADEVEGALKVFGFSRASAFCEFARERAFFRRLSRGATAGIRVELVSVPGWIPRGILKAFGAFP